MDFFNHYWLPFRLLVIIFIVGTKLQIIITKMCVESYKNSFVVRGSFLVKPNDELFWFFDLNGLFVVSLHASLKTRSSHYELSKIYRFG